MSFGQKLSKHPPSCPKKKVKDERRLDHLDVLKSVTFIRDGASARALLLSVCIALVADHAGPRRARRASRRAHHVLISFCFCIFICPHNAQPAHKSFRIKRILGKKQKQNRPIPQWIRMKTDNTIRCVASSGACACICMCMHLNVRSNSSVSFAIFQSTRYNSKRRHWRRTKMGL